MCELHIRVCFIINVVLFRSFVCGCFCQLSTSTHIPCFFLLAIVEARIYSRSSSSRVCKNE